VQAILKGRWNRHSSNIQEARTLWKVRNDYDQEKATLQDLKSAQDNLTKVFLKEIEDMGVDVISDGGFRWDSIYDIARGFNGCEGFSQLTRIPETNQFHRQSVVSRPIRIYAPEPVLVNDLNFAKENTKLPLVYSLPGPYSLARQVANDYQFGIRNLARVFADVLNKEAVALIDAGANMILFEESQILSHPEDYEIFRKLMGRLTVGFDRSKIGLAVYFDAVDKQFPDFFELPFGTFAVDLVEGAETRKYLKDFPKNKKLIAGLFNARSPGVDDVDEVMAKLKFISEHVSLNRIMISTSSDLHFLPWDEAMSKVEAMVSFAKSVNRNKVRDFDEKAKLSVRAYRATDLAELKSDVKKDYLNVKKDIPGILTLFPTSTVGSFPQYKELRALRAGMNRGEALYPLYLDRVVQLTKEWIDFQDSIGITVPVDGEFSREDMAVYFGVRLRGFLGDFVPSYENRRYRPVIYDNDIKFSDPMTVADFKMFQELTGRPLKATITGPATLADWGLVANDKYKINPLTFRMDLARALRREVEALLEAGAKVIQIDEPALTTKMKYFGDDIAAIYEVIRGLEDRAYFILHICYSSRVALDEAMPHILRLPFHQVHMEMANRNYELMDLIDKHGFAGKDIGLGVVDVHTNRIETLEEIVKGVDLALKYFTPYQVWLTPDCGLKERSVEVSKNKMIAMTEAAAFCRERLG